MTTPTPTDAEPQVSVAFLAVDAIRDAAMKAGWEPREAFETAMLLHINGVSVEAATALFQHAARWKQ